MNNKKPKKPKVVGQDIDLCDIDVREKKKHYQTGC